MCLVCTGCVQGVHLQGYIGRHIYRVYIPTMVYRGIYTTLGTPLREEERPPGTLGGE